MQTFQAFLIKYAEIGIKGKNRSLFEEALARQIRRTLRKVEGEFEVLRERGRVYVRCLSEYDFDETVNALKKVFGITGICPVKIVDDEGFEKLAEDVIEYFDLVYPDKNRSFKVHARRARKDYPKNSMEIDADLGERLLEAYPALSVDVHNPDIMLEIEIRSHINIYSIIIPGPGGMPIGRSGKAMLLLSGGIDSPVAGYMIAKRGIIIDAIYFHAPPYTSIRARQKVVDLAKQISEYAGTIYLHVVNFTDIQMYIYETCPHDELTIIMRRYMMRIAEHFAEKSGCLGLVTGESIGQVASQTLPSLACTDEVCNMPVYRPLIGFDKQEIVEYAQKIGTYDTSILPYEDCCTIFVAKHPVTKPNKNVIRCSENRLVKMEELVEKAIADTEVVVIN